MKLFDSELKVMDVLWRLGDRTAKEISSILGEETGWNVNTTYTVIKKCVAKGAVRRSEPNFLCHALVTKEEIQKRRRRSLLEGCSTDRRTCSSPLCSAARRSRRSRLGGFGRLSAK